MTNKRLLTAVLFCLSLAACGVAALHSSTVPPPAPGANQNQATGGFIGDNGLAPTAFIAGNVFAGAPDGQ